MLEVRLLGRFEVSRDGKSIALISRPAQSLFAFLILNAGTSHRREKLAGLLWPDSLEETARDNLRHALWRVRKALETAASTRFLEADDQTIRFKTSEEYWLDAAALEKTDETVSADKLITILSDYRGELLPGFYDEWVVLEREHLYSIFEHHMARLMSLLQEERRWLDILEWGERWIKLGQKPEPAYRALMKAHAAKGDMSKVVATYQRCLKSLKEFGVEPSEQTRALYERLKTGNETLETGLTVSMVEKRESQPKTNLPVPITSFIGREKEVEEIISIVEMNRLMTLTGPGGVGKTRLSIEASNRLLSRFKDGVWWVELAPLTSETLVPQAIAQALGLHEIPNQSLNETLTNFLHLKHLLLVLDNCEHLIDGCAQLANDLPTHCRNLKILATSREALGITGETMYQVPSLSLPMSQRLMITDFFMEYEGIRLFVERASAVKSDFMLTEQNATTVLEICRRLDGIPLALELVTARTNLFTVKQIAERLNDRFNLLTQGSRTALPRHQTLRAAIDWSYELLSPAEQTLFNRLSVFAGWFTLHAAEEAAAGVDVSGSQVLDLLGQLISKSLVLVQVQTEVSKSETRYGMLETIHEYAREKLVASGEEDYVRARHLRYFLQLSEQAESALKGPTQMEWLARLQDERDNLHAALIWAAKAKDIEAGLYIAGNLRSFWRMRNLREGERWLTEFINQPESHRYPKARAQALYAYGSVLWQLQKFIEAHHAAEECLAISRACGDRQSEIDGLLLVGSTMQHLATQERKAEIEQEALALSISIDDPWRQAEVLADLGWDHREYVRARTYWEKAATLYREVGDFISLVDLLGSLGELEFLYGDFESAQKRLDEAFNLHRQMNNQVFSPNFALALSKMASMNGDFEQGRFFLEEVMKIAEESGDRMGYLWGRTHLGHLALRQGNLSEARNIFSETHEIFSMTKLI